MSLNKKESRRDTNCEGNMLTRLSSEDLKGFDRLDPAAVKGIRLKRSRKDSLTSGVNIFLGRMKVCSQAPKLKAQTLQGCEAAMSGGKVNQTQGRDEPQAL